jgi:2-dehydropantoate 2-reductase
MRIAIVAAGAVGGYFGGLLAASGEDVVALARGAHRDAIQTNGLRLEGPRGDTTVRLLASDDAAQFGIADIVLFAVKLYQIEDAARAAAPLFGPRTLGISLLNGIGGAEAAASVIPRASVAGGVAYVSAVIAAPGHIRYASDMSSLVFGAPTDPGLQATATGFVERCRRAGFGAEMVDDVRGALWNKLIGLSANAALTSASRLPAGPLYTDPDVVAVAVALVAEATAVARALGVDLPDDIEQTWVERFKNFPPRMYASMYHDIAQGRPIEVDGLSGHIIREGRRLGIPTPHHAALFAVLKPHRAGAPALS